METLKKETFKKEILQLIEERVSSLTQIERVIFTKTYKLSNNHKDLFSIQTIPIIYSYWEGFINLSFKKYIEYINSSEVRLEDCCDSIIIYDTETKFKQFMEYPKNKGLKLAFYNKLVPHFKEENLNISKSFNTESNVSFKVLNRLLETFNLEKFSKYWDKYQHPNKNLEEIMNDFLKYRNSVAHGGDISSEVKVTQEVYSKYKKLVVDLMYEILNKMIEGLEEKKYLK